jgi:hypothetical protein
MSKYQYSNPEFSVNCPGFNYIDFGLNPDHSFYFEGSEINHNFSYFDLEINLKENLINKSSNNSAIIENLKNLRLKIFYQNVNVDIETGNLTAAYYLSFTEIPLGTSNFVTGKLAFMQNSITEDKNYFFSDINSNKNAYITYDDSSSNIYYSPEKSITSKIKQFTKADDFWNSKNTLELLNLRFFKTKSTSKYVIQYKKLPFLIAQAGGVLNAIVVFIKILADNLMDFQFYSKILQWTLDLDFNSTKISDGESKENKVNTCKQGGGDRLKKLFSEINFIQIDKKKTSLDKNNKMPSNSARKINDQSDFGLNNESHIKENIIDYGSPPFKNNEILDRNHQINMKKKSKNDGDGNSQNSEIMDADRANKFNSFIVAAEKAKNANGGQKKTTKKKDDVFFKDDVFNFVDFVYDIYKYCSRSKIQPIGYIKELDNRNELFEKSKNNFYKNFEVSNIMKKNIEIDIIKFLLMSSDQLNLYRLVKKPLISFKNSDLSAFDKAYDEFSQDRLYSKDELRSLDASKKEEIKMSFLNIHEKKQSNIVNRKLLRMVEDRISLFLEE